MKKLSKAVAVLILMVVLSLATVFLPVNSFVPRAYATPPPFPCDKEHVNETYEDDQGNIWTCEETARGNYVWYILISLDEDVPPCDEDHAGHMYQVIGSSVTFQCRFEDGEWKWVKLDHDPWNLPKPQTSGLAGTGILTTDLTFISEMPPCTLAGDNYGGMVDLDSAEIAGITGPMYVGPATAAWQVDEGFKYYDGGWGYAGWRSDDGTYGTASDCSGSEEPGTPWGITATISGQNNVGDTVSCSYSGNYSRSHYKDINLSNLNGNCTVAMHNSSANTFNVENDEWKATIGDWVSGQNPFIPVYADLYDFTLGG